MTGEQLQWLHAWEEGLSRGGALPTPPPAHPARPSPPPRPHHAHAVTAQRRSGRTFLAARPARTPQLTKDAPNPPSAHCPFPRLLRPSYAGKVCRYNGEECPQGCKDPSPSACICASHQHKTATSAGGALFWGVELHRLAQQLCTIPAASCAAATRAQCSFSSAFPRTPPSPCISHPHTL